MSDMIYTTAEPHVLGTDVAHHFAVLMSWQVHMRRSPRVVVVTERAGEVVLA